MNDQSITADSPIQFDPAIPPPPPPTLVVTPSTDLLNGQTVTVTGTDYPANSMVALIECLDPPTTDPFNCSYATATYTMSDGFGSIATPMAVRRIVRFDGTSTDCATAGACVILSAVQEVGDGATASIQFDGSVPPPPPPSVTVTPNTDLLDGDTVTVTGADFTPDATVVVLQCTVDASDPAGCNTSNVLLVQTDGSGGVNADLVVDRILYIGGQTVDCADIGACTVSIGELPEGYPSAAAAIQFDPSVPPPPPPTLTATRRPASPTGRP